MAAKRELIDTGTDKRYVRRNAKGQFKESDDVGRSLAADRRQKAKAVAKPGQGDKGDRRPAWRKSNVQCGGKTVGGVRLSSGRSAMMTP